MSLGSRENRRASTHPRIPVRRFSRRSPVQYRPAGLSLVAVFCDVFQGVWFQVLDAKVLDVRPLTATSVRRTGFQNCDFKIVVEVLRLARKD